MNIFTDYIIPLIPIIISLYSLYRSSKIEKKLNNQEKINRTIDAYSCLQREVLDSLVHCSKQDVLDAVIGYENGDETFVEVYKDYKVQLAKCNHFAVAIKNGIYDFDTFDKLGGMHIKYLYEKLEPIIEESRLYLEDNNLPFSDFEDLYKRLSTNY